MESVGSPGNFRIVLEVALSVEASQSRHGPTSSHAKLQCLLIPDISLTIRISGSLACQRHAAAQINADQWPGLPTYLGEFQPVSRHGERMDRRGSLLSGRPGLVQRYDVAIGDPDEAIAAVRRMITPAARVHLRIEEQLFDATFFGLELTRPSPPAAAALTASDSTPNFFSRQVLKPVILFLTRWPDGRFRHL